MAVEGGWLDTVFDASPRLSYRARSGDTLSSSTLEVYEREEDDSPSPRTGDMEHNSPDSGKGEATVNGVVDTDGELPIPVAGLLASSLPTPESGCSVW